MEPSKLLGRVFGDVNHFDFALREFLPRELEDIVLGPRPREVKALDRDMEAVAEPLGTELGEAVRVGIPAFLVEVAHLCRGHLLEPGRELRTQFIELPAIPPFVAPCWSVRFRGSVIEIVGCDDLRW